MRVLVASVALLALCSGSRAARFFGWDIASPHFNFSASGDASNDLAAAAHRLANETAGIIANLTEALKEHHKFVPAPEKNVSLAHAGNFTIPSLNFSWMLKDGANVSHLTLPTNTSGLLFKGNFTKGNFTNFGTFTGNVTGLFNKTIGNKTISNKTTGAAKFNITDVVG